MGVLRSKVVWNHRKRRGISEKWVFFAVLWRFQSRVKVLSCFKGRKWFISSRRVYIHTPWSPRWCHHLPGGPWEPRLHLGGWEGGVVEGTITSQFKSIIIQTHIIWVLVIISVQFYTIYVITREKKHNKTATQYSLWLFFLSEWM